MFSMSSAGISSYGTRPNVINSHSTTPNDHCVCACMCVCTCVCACGKGIEEY